MEKGLLPMSRHIGPNLLEAFASKNLLRRTWISSLTTRVDRREYMQHQLCGFVHSYGTL